MPDDAHVAAISNALMHSISICMFTGCGRAQYVGGRWFIVMTRLYSYVPKQAMLLVSIVCASICCYIGIK